MKILYIIFISLFAFLNYGFKYLGTVKRCSILPFAILRNGPSENFIRLARLLIGTKLEVLNIKNNWAKIKLKNNFYGWLKLSELNLQKDNRLKYFPFYLYNIKVKSLQDSDLIYISLTDKVPFIINELDNSLIIRFFNTLDKIFEIKQDIHLKIIEGIYLKQVDSEELDLVIKLKPFKGYKVFYKDDNVLVVQIFYPDLKRIILDPGHGGKDTGAIGKNGLMEKSVNLKLCKILKRKLGNRGFKVILTRDKDESVCGKENFSTLEELYSRVVFAQKNKGDIFISIHFNALPDINQGLKARGSFVYYYRPFSRKLAYFIAKQLAKNLNQGKDNTAFIYRSFHVIRQSQMPSVLVESEFISNPDIEKLLKDKRYLDNIANAIFKGILNYFDFLNKKVIITNLK